MKNIHFTFYRPEKINLNEFYNIIGKLELDLKTLCEEEVSTLSINHYVFRLLSSSKPLDDHPEMCFLGLSDPCDMPSDCRVEFFYMPTYLSTAFVMRSLVLHPEILTCKGDWDWEYSDKNSSLVREVLPKLMLGCTGGGFAGHGFDGLKGVIETLLIFEKAQAGEFLEKYPDFCPEFTELYHSSLEMIRRKKAEGTLHNEWGEDYTELARDF